MFGLLLATCHGNTNCLLGAKNLIFNLFLKSIKTLQPKTWSRYNTIILVYIGVHVLDYLRFAWHKRLFNYMELLLFELMAKIWSSFS